MSAMGTIRDSIWQALGRRLGAGENETAAEPACTFCGRAGDEVAHLIAGPDVFICDVCVESCVGVLADKDQEWREQQIASLTARRGA
ncbi:MAG TPA: ClpX C4-type zinc finger protein [Stellaceae bacterium]|nr:ClpX C4-type zinc finger protein [Stellaceae bacterium]